MLLEMQQMPQAQRQLAQQAAPVPWHVRLHGVPAEARVPAVTLQQPVWRGASRLSSMACYGC